METESLEIEEGELLDDESADVFETYTVLQRPHTVPKVMESPKMGYSDDESDLSVDSDSDSDSDSGKAHIKRPKIKAIRRRNITNHRDPRNDKYKVWCAQVQEESLTENLVSCGVTKKNHQERHVENYNFKLHYSHDERRKNNTNNSSEDEKEIEYRLTNKRTNSERQNIKLRLGKRRNSMEVDNQKGSVRIIEDLNTTIESTEEELAADIAVKLHETKDTLIRRVIDILGKEQAIDFFYKAKKIEEDGGMLIMNGSRRRTTGGVYFWLVKNDEYIPQEKIREVFYIVKKESAEQKRKDDKERRNRKCELIKNLENGSNKDLPALLTRAELSTRQIAEEARLRRGEGMDRISLDSDRTVTNPPPSPVTDDPDHTEHSIGQRQVQNYGEDFLDIGIDVDNMEVF